MTSEAISAEVLVREYTKELHNRNAAAFLGAGLSIPAGYVDWNRLLQTVMTDLRLNPDDERDLVSIAQYYCNQTGSKAGLTQIIFDHFSSVRQPTDNHRILARLPIQTYWTTNYDKLVEMALHDAKKVPDIKYTHKQLSVTRLDRDVLVYKMHGDIDHPADAVICRDDYEKYPHLMSEFISALQGDLIEKTFLFLGLSFTDPNIDYILSRVRALYQGSQRQHYCINRRVSQEKNESSEHFEYRKLKQHYFIKDMKRFGIQTVLVDEYSDITQILHTIEARYKRRSIFISGAASEYGNWSESVAQCFMHDLSYKILERRNRIITGFGLGVGSSIINGSLACLNNNGKTISDDDLVMRPFPQVATGNHMLTDQWRLYRKDMIDHAGIALFLYGNKLDAKNEIVLSQGMQEEFDLCIDAGVCPLPIGATGYMAEKIWRDVSSDINKYYPNASGIFLQLYDSIGDSKQTPDNLLSSILNQIDILQRG